ncbi:MAG: pectinacetylesterase family protein [bacterium]|nr:pectinacetylesterase family protein [bacterium]
MNNRIWKYHLLAISLVPFLFAACVAEADQPSDTELAGISLFAILNQPSGWERQEVQSGSISIPVQGSTTRNFSYSPTCSGRIGTNADYAFFVKPGDSNLMIHFMGGGACWDADNCTGADATATYIPELSIFGSLNREIVASRVATGILSSTDTRNSLSGYTKIYIPYCTGDVHQGSNDQVYTDPVTGNPTTIHHRGFDNFLAVLQYLKTNYPSSNVGRVVVVGQSAGASGALFNFPYIKETYRSNGTHLIMDGTAGVSASATQKSQSVTNWGSGSNAPDWIAGISSAGMSTITMGNFIQSVANHYSTTRISQVNSAFDGPQRFMYNVGLLLDSGKAYVPDSTMWGGNVRNLSAYAVADSVSCDWHDAMEAERSTAAGAANYRSFTSPGDLHVLTQDSYYFSVTGSDNLVLSGWISLMVNDSGGWTSKNCTACSPPVTQESSPAALNCP